jgi:hypothetical protein
MTGMLRKPEMSPTEVGLISLGLQPHWACQSRGVASDPENALGLVQDFL